jgi:hypothetical protein
LLRTIRLTTSIGGLVFKSAEEREADRRKREAEEARAKEAQAEQLKAAEEKRQRAAFLATAVGAATLAKEAGDPFFEVQLRVGRHTGTAGFGTTDTRHTTSSSATTLGEIEKLGWHLEHAGYFYMMTGESSTGRVFLSGEATAISGSTVGVYLFRSTDAPGPPAGAITG